jgi:hypothetical protein
MRFPALDYPDVSARDRRSPLTPALSREGRGSRPRPSNSVPSPSKLALASLHQGMPESASGFGRERDRVRGKSRAVLVGLWRRHRGNQVPETHRVYPEPSRPLALVKIPCLQAIISMPVATHGMTEAGGLSSPTILSKRQRLRHR